MKKAISLMLALGIVCSAFTSFFFAAGGESTPASEQPGLLCSDPGFETGEDIDRTTPNVDKYMGQWTTNTQGENGIHITNEKAFKGSKSLRIKSANWATGYFALGFSVERNTDYTLTFHYYAASDWKPPFLYLVPLTDNSNCTYGDPVTDRFVFFDDRTKEQWHTVTVTFNSGNGFGDSMQPVLHMLIGTLNDNEWDNKINANTTIYLDEVYLEKVTDVEQREPIGNDSGFEGKLETMSPAMGGPLPGWTANEQQSNNGGVYHITDNPHGGSKALKYVNKGNNSFAPAAFTTYAGTDYELKFWYRADAENAHSSLGIRIANFTLSGWKSITEHGNAMNSTPIGEFCSTEWKQAVFRFRADKTGMVMAFFEGLDNDVPIYLDDIVLKKAAPIEEDPDELFQNGGFELPYSFAIPSMGNSMNLWSQADCKAYDAYIVRSTEQAHQGNYSVKLKMPTWNVDNLAFGFDVELGKDYQLDFWYYLADVTNNGSAINYTGAQINIKSLNNYGTTWLNLAENLSPATGFPETEKNKWQKCTITFNAGEAAAYPNNNHRAYLNFNALPARGIIYLDDISVREYDPSQYETDTNQFPYGSFEAGLAGWTPAQGFWGANAVTDNPHSGKRCLRLDGGDYDYIPTTSDKFSLKPNTDYVISFYYRGKGNWTQIFVNDGATDKRILDKNFGDGTVTEAWTQVTHQFRTGESEQYYLVLQKLKAADCYIDDIHILEITDNLIMNGDFTSGELFWSYDSNVYTIEKLSGAEGKETSAIHAKNGANSLLSQSVSLTKGKNYELSFDYKGTLPAGISYWSVSNEKPTFAKDNLMAYGALEGSTDWKKVTAVFSAPETAAYYVNFQSVGTADYVIDNVSVTETRKAADKYVQGKDAAYISEFIRRSDNIAYKLVPKSGTNIIGDGGFEVGGGQWDNEAFLDTVISVVTDGTAVHSGSRGLKLAAQSSKKLSFYVDVEPNTEYMFGIWVKATPYVKDTNLNRCSFGLAEPDTGAFVRERTLTSYDGEWHLYEYSFQTNAAEKLAFRIEAEHTTVYLDDLFICKMSDTEDYKPPLSTKDKAAVVNEKPTLLGCDDNKNLLENYDFAAVNDSGFWSKVNGSVYGKQVKIVNSGSTVYGNSLHYQPTDDAYGNARATGAYYIKWIDVEPHTDYTFSGKFSLVEASRNGIFTNSYFGFIDSNPLMTSAIKMFPMDARTYDENHIWQTAAVTMNTGDYDKIGFVIYDAGGEAYFDDLRLFKTADAKQLTKRVDNFPATELKSSSYTQKDDAYTIDSATSIRTLLATFQYQQYVRFYSAKGELITDHNMLIATGMEIRLMNGPEIKDRATISVKGDIDGNGKVDAADAELLLGYLSGNVTELTKAQLSAADYDNNGKIDIYDVMQNTAAYGALKNAQASVSGPSALSVGEAFEVELTVPQGLYGLSAVISYDPEKLIFQDVSLNLGGGWKLSSNNTKGVLKLSAADLTRSRATGNLPVLTITFVVASTVQANDVITVSASELMLTDGSSMFKAGDCKWTFGESTASNNTPGNHGTPSDTTTPGGSNYVPDNRQPENPEMQPGDPEEEPSSNNLLERLEVEGVTLTPEFTPDNKNYEASVAFEIDNVKVTAVPQDEKATVTIEDTELKFVGRNIVRVTVLSESGLKRTYRVYITRQDRAPTAGKAGFGYWWLVIAGSAVVVLGAAAVVTVLIVKKRRQAQK